MSRLCTSCQQFEAGTLRPAVVEKVIHASKAQTLVLLCEEGFTPSGAESELRKRWTTQVTLNSIKFPRCTLDDDTLLWWHGCFGDLCNRATRWECQICCMAFEVFRSYSFVDAVNGISKDAPVLPNFALSRNRDQVRYLRLTVLTNEDRPLSAVLEISDMHGLNTGLPRNQCGVVAGIPIDTLERLRRWIRVCSSEHANCEPRLRPETASVLPTRLVQVEETPSGLTARLIETSQTDADIKYATLSHCWGPQGLTVKLSSNNYEDWLEDIPIKTLPRTFQEALPVMNALGIRYIWIDALCIKQDSDREDWFKEAPRMQTVYAKGIINLAATASKSGDDGLIVQDRCLSPCILAINLREIDLYNRALILYDAGQMQRNVTTAPLNRRGWCFQERLLAPRVIHFSQSEIYWECADSFNAEFDLNRPDAEYSPAEDFRCWHWSKLITTYTQLALTHPKDRLIAIAGIADAFALEHGLESKDYLAGLWRHSLLKGLCWFYHEDDKDKALDPHSSKIAPSWSWASRPSNGIVMFTDSEALILNPVCNILQASTELYEDSPFGAVGGGTIRMQLLLLEVSQVLVHSLAVRDRRQGELCIGKREDDDWGAYRGFCGAMNGWALAKQLYVSPLAWWAYSTNNDISDGEDYCGRILVLFLILRAVHGQTGRYVKVNGHQAMTWKEKGSKGLPSWFSEGSRLDESLFLKDHGSGVYEIEII